MKNLKTVNLILLFAGMLIGMVFISTTRSTNAGNDGFWKFDREPTYPTAFLDEHEDEEHEGEERDEEDWNDEAWEEDEDEEHWEEEWDEEWHEVHGMLRMIEHVHELAERPSATAVMAVLHVEEFYEERSEAVDFLEEILPEAKNGTVRRVIRIQLVEHYLEEGEREKAQQHLRALITEAE